MYFTEEGMDFFGLLSMIGGLALFLYGMDTMGQGLEKLSGGRLERILEKLTSNPIKAVLLGAGVTAVIQSSSATTVMVVGFVNSGIMKLTQAVGIIMGANIGTTVTSWLLSLTGIESGNFFVQLLKPSSFSPVLALIGMIFIMFTKNEKKKNLGTIMIGFAILMFGMETMSDAVKPLADVPEFTGLLTMFSNPILGMIAGAVLTAVIQSSSASVGILQSLAAAGLVPMSAAVYIIMGQNIGTCVTAMLSSVGAKRNAKTAALMHLLFNVIGTVIFSIVAIIFFTVMNPALGENLITQTEISTVHTIFNIGTTVLLFPVSNWIITLAKKLGRVEECTQEDDVVLLDDRMLQTPGIALQSTVTEIVRMGNIVAETLKESKEVLFTKSEETIKSIKEKESVVDKLSAGITDYAIKITALQVSEKEHQDVAHLLQVVSDMERICDYCENISECAEAMRERKLEFSEIATEEIKQMMDVCVESYLYAKEAFFEKSSEKAVKVIEKETLADDLEVRLRNKHIKRLANNQCNAETGIFYLDTLVSMERISDHARNIAEEIMNPEN